MGEVAGGVCAVGTERGERSVGSSVGLSLSEGAVEARLRCVADVRSSCARWRVGELIGDCR